MSFNVTVKKTDLRKIINEVSREIKYLHTRRVCNAALTHQLFLERKEAINSVGILSENSSRFEVYNQKAELIQLNEVLYPYFLQNKAFRDDLYSRIARKTIAELREKGLVDEDSQKDFGIVYKLVLAALPVASISF